MIKVIIQEYKTSAQEESIMPATHAHMIGLAKVFYKIQLIGEFGQSDFEYKAQE